MQTPALFTALAAYAQSQQWQYIYPVWSRRAHGLSIGINLHPNHCCNWHCIYCQVPGLQRGPSPVINENQLQKEFADCFKWLAQACAKQNIDLHAFVQDIAFAGDGEPTTSPQFEQILDHVIHWRQSQPEEARPATVRLITNGSQLHRVSVQAALRRLHSIGGEVWFKLDAGTDAEMLAVNATHLPLARHMQRLETCTQLCKTWIQTAVLSRKIDSMVHTSPTLNSYLAQVQPLRHAVQGILLYGIARPSQQDPEGVIQAPPVGLLESYAQTLRTHGFCVRIFE